MHLGNFGELRPNHFHAGFDFKTLQREGLKVYAVADGCIKNKNFYFWKRKAIYITHQMVILRFIVIYKLEISAYIKSTIQNRLLKLNCFLKQLI
jgi:hypothetical protein